MLEDVLDKNEQHLIQGEIYVITNKFDGKQYIGQTLTHRLNKGKYRPFGYRQRFLDHVSEALGQKKKQSRYLNNAIRKYGQDIFTVKLILRCSIEELDEYECKYIEKYQSLYPNGYNLTHGGKGAFPVKHNIVMTKSNVVKVPYKHTNDTKKKISKQLKKKFNTPDMKENLKTSAIIQHEKARFLKFSNVIINQNIDVKRLIKRRKESYYINIQNIKTQFFFKTEDTRNEAYQRAISFLEKLKQQNQIAGSH